MIVSLLVQILTTLFNSLVALFPPWSWNPNGYNPQLGSAGAHAAPITNIPTDVTSVLCYVNLLDYFFPISDYIIPAASIYFTLTFIFTGYNTVLKVINLVRGSGIK